LSDTLWGNSELDWFLFGLSDRVRDRVRGELAG
jgi:hypothetical protein